MSDAERAFLEVAPTVQHTEPNPYANTAWDPTTHTWRTA